MVDVRKLFDDALWENIAYRAEKGEHPSRQELITAMREKGVPRDMGAYVAARLTAQRGRGAPKLSGSKKEQKWARLVSLTTRVRCLQAKYKSDGKKSPRERALQEVAKEEYVSPDTLRKKLRTELKESPHWVRGLIPTHAQCEAFVLDEKQGGKKIRN